MTPATDISRPANDPNDGDGGLDIKELLGILRRRKKVILATVLLVTCLAVLAGLQLTPKYTATALVMIDPRKSNVVDVESVIQGLGTDASTVESQVRLISSRFQLERLADDLRIYDDPEFNVALRNPDSTVQMRMAGPLETLVSWMPESWLVATGLAAEPVEISAADQLSMQHQATIEAFGDGLKVTPEGRSYVIRIAFTSESSSKAATIVNAVANDYVDMLREEKVDKTKLATEWLAQRLDQLRAEVEVAEAAVERYRADHNINDLNGVTLNEQRLFDVNQRLSELRADEAGAQAKIAQIRQMRTQGFEAVEAVPEVLNSVTIINLRDRETELLKEESELRSTFGAKHPRIVSIQQEKATLVAKIQAEVARILKTIENDADVTASRIKALEREIDTVSGGTSLDREVAVKLRELERDADASRNIYNSFLERYKEMADQQELIEADAKVVSTGAPPMQPSTPGPKLFGAVGFTASLMLGTLLALLLERFDNGLRSARQVEQTLGLPALGLVPRLDRLRRGQRPHQYLLAKPLSAYSESLRAIYTSLQLSNIDDPPRVVLVTSSLPQEGKTTLAVSLCTFAALSGRKVVLIDGDLRHPNVHRELGGGHENGLIEYLAGERSLDEVILTNEETGIAYLPVKRQTANPTELLGSRRMRELLTALRESYDFIVIDSAPLLGVTDTKLVSQLADKVLFVTLWDKTSRDTALNALAHLREARGQVAGVVLTQVDLRRHAQYGYGDVGQYYGKYQKYYVN
ncbi:MAG: polysaccharide biosynthesis tyrosine autokinase [Geminicoccaceae bacterium]